MRRVAIAILCVLLLVVVYLPGCTIMKAQNRAPVAVFTATPKSINTGETIYFSANESKDKDGKIVKYAWDFGDGSYSLEKFTDHKYEKAGNFTVGLVVTDDGNGVDRANTTVHVNAWPFAEGRSGKDPAKVNDIVQFDGSESVDKDGKITEYIWDFGDGTNLVKGVSPSHKYSKIGTYNVSLKVTDNDQASNSFDFRVRIIKRNYKVLWQETSKILTTFSEYNQENSTTNKTYKVTMNNMTRLVFNLTWKDPFPLIGPPNDDFMFNVTDPEANKKHSEGTSEIIEETFHIDEVPETINMEADSVDQVWAQMANKYKTTKGNGEWDMSIYLVDTGMWILNLTHDPQRGTTWQVQITAYYYLAQIMEIG
jgi:PKD repeat protein